MLVKINKQMEKRLHKLQLENETNTTIQETRFKESCTNNKADITEVKGKVVK
jgi:hypothetical protein